MTKLAYWFHKKLETFSCHELDYPCVPLTFWDYKSILYNDEQLVMSMKGVCLFPSFIKMFGIYTLETIAINRHLYPFLGLREINKLNTSEKERDCDLICWVCLVLNPRI